MRLTIHIDGGSRGNPGPAASGIVITAEDGTILHKAGLFLGQATNNVAEYKGLVAGLHAAKRLGAGEVDVFSDSQLLVRQMNGEYRVKNENLKGLFRQAKTLAGGFERFTCRYVQREQNKQADSLVNQALDLEQNVGDADVE